MEFKGPYLQKMSENAPRLLKSLRLGGGLNEHLQAKSQEAHDLLGQLLANEPKYPNGLPKNLQALHQAEEIVRSQLTEFETDLPSERSRLPSPTPRPT